MSKEALLKGLKGIGPYFLTPAMLVFVIWKTSQFTERSQYVQFDTPEDKVNTMNHVENAPQDVELYKATQKFDSISKVLQKESEVSVENAQNAIQSRSRRDSMQIENTRSIALIRQELRNQQVAQENIISSLKHLEELTEQVIKNYPENDHNR